MKRNCFLTALVCLSALMLVTSCTDSKFPGYKKTADGLYYKFYQQDKSAKAPQLTDFVKVHMACYLNDSLFFDWPESQGITLVQVDEPHFPGDLQAAYAMMHEGDSASFFIKADSIATIYYHQDLEEVGLGADDYFRYDIKLMEVKTEEAFMAEIEQRKADKAAASRAALEAYVAENGIDVTPTDSGVYIIPIKPGKGRSPMTGEEVEIDYEVRTLNGDVIASTFDKEEKLSFVIGDGFAIKGLEDVLPKMQLGSTVRAIVPADMAYGEHFISNLPPFSNLIYDIKLLKITTAEELARRAEKALLDAKKQSEKDFMTYVKENGIEKHTESGLYYMFGKENNGKVPAVGQICRVKFDARIMNGEHLGSSEQLGDYYDVVYGRGTVLRGLEEGLGLMTKGDKATFVLPYKLAYGEKEYGTIPAFSNLIFDVEMLDILSNEEAYANEIDMANQEFEKYLKDNKIKAEKRESGLVYVCTRQGSGPQPTPGQKVKVHYTGKFVDGRVFDSSVERGEPFEFVLGQGRVIKGWDEGIALMRKGEKGTLVLPYYLAYGTQQRGDIPAYSTLVFDVELIDIE